MTNFHDIDNKNNLLPEENKPYKCMSLISLDYIIKINKNIIRKHFYKNVYTNL